MFIEQHPLTQTLGSIELAACINYSTMKISPYLTLAYNQWKMATSCFRVIIVDVLAVCLSTFNLMIMHSFSVQTTSPFTVVL